MKVKELINQLQDLPQDDEIVITAMDDKFICANFEVCSPYDEQAQEIIMNVYINDYNEDSDD